MGRELPVATRVAWGVEYQARRHGFLWALACEKEGIEWRDWREGHSRYMYDSDFDPVQEPLHQFYTGFRYGIDDFADALKEYTLDEIMDRELYVWKLGGQASLADYQARSAFDVWFDKKEEVHVG